MELDVTHMVEDADNMIELSGSVMEHGADASQRTWNNSLAYAEGKPLLKTDEQRDAARAHFKGYGAWDDAEIAAWSEDHLQGIMVQEVAHAIREMEMARDDDGELDLEKYHNLCSEGVISGNLSPGDNGRWYFYLGS